MLLNCLKKYVTLLLNSFNLSEYRSTFYQYIQIKLFHVICCWWIEVSCEKQHVNTTIGSVQQWLFNKSISWKNWSPSQFLGKILTYQHTSSVFRNKSIFKSCDGIEWLRVGRTTVFEKFQKSFFSDSHNLS